MSEWIEFLWRAIFIGIGATLVMDIYKIIIKKLLGIKSLDFGLVGRWIGHFTKGQFYHNNITKSTPVRGEKIIGWTAHYLIGISFTTLLLFIWGIGWTKNPTIIPALIIGILTVAAPLFIMQPALGFGVAASKTPNPKVSRISSFLTHTIYGLGIYLAALLLKIVLN
ncbi:DUF2938 domain-containing protein [Constantimarinum furrinae]|uniref:Membrane protein n=1 Tax=Constantimarinum furrinae TaxID=2562285 RepID=A0A7G8PTH7_9FLAO|nr:DUF2938 domain-containing protein [Constantimarinum furrinae]QNJ97643.1 Putative membrane protein [Constantimarinum furrinae]